ncbi:hypothetical protein [Clostridium sp. Marseille-Q2269]|uniref:hypothetical protein n=1 Tax=Clostridium sp. Marseille-Q2269 TaxID=2942205 RepID=UPI0020738854|nr:hypothetical protein [Clostridium sp. Marseille-Q2269]
MKKNKILYLILISIISIGLSFGVQAKGISSRSSISRPSISHSSSSRSSFRSNSIKSSSIKSPKGLKATNVRTKTASKPTSKTINNNTKINNTVIHNHYNAPRHNTTYYTPHGGSFRSSFWDNYWMYRALTNHNTVVVTRAGGTSQTIDYGYSGIWKDILTLLILIIIVIFITKKIRKRY